MEPSAATVYINHFARTWTTQSPKDARVEAFHRRLPEYAATPLTPLPRLAKELGVGHVLLKDESQRFGLPSFKILGASWAIYRALAAKTGLPLTAPLDDVGAAARELSIGLVACSDGNWGRAVARMARYLQIRATIFVPGNIDKATQDKIASEGAEVLVVDGDYDKAIQSARSEAERTHAVLTMDTSWEGYEEFPKWVVEGYMTGLTEVDSQALSVTGVKAVTHAIASVGVGSWAHAVVAHYKSRKDMTAAVITVEPKTACCLMTSLSAGTITPIKTGDTIMCGMNCGTVSLVAWPTLRRGVDVNLAISDEESDQAVKDLRGFGVQSGPCGAAPLAALRAAVRAGTLYGESRLGPDSVVVLFSTEGERAYTLR